MGHLRRRTAATLAVGLVSVAVVVGCATPRDGDPAAAPGPAASQADDTLLTTRYPVTVLDDGGGPELCLGGVMESYPPQCGGPALVGWDQDEWGGDFEAASGVRWGDFVVTGRYDADADADTFTVDEARPGAESDWSAGPEPDFSSACAEPDGGWRVLDAATTNDETMYATLDLAASLDGYSGAWLDQSPNPAFGRVDDGEDDFDLDRELAMNDPELLILNVVVTGDTAEAEAVLREVWGGMLCVSHATHSEAELNAVLEAIVADQQGFLSGGGNVLTGRVEITVVHDDGSVQDYYDAEYGPGVVAVSSALVPVG